ncbi:MAG: DUF2855 family protein [Actinomycetota bacterium]|nr:DUF2855 family protein [Actinomycetota bacterium]
MSNGQHFVVRRDDLHVCKFIDDDESERELTQGQVCLRLEKFGLTANNVTYAVYGDAIGYWGYFPTQEQGWGRNPVWGFGVVAASANHEVKVGERYYGFFPISTRLVVDAKANSIGLRDEAPHRSQLPRAYNQYFATERDPVYDRGHEDEQLILRPLFITSFLAFDFLEDGGFKGAKAVLLSSASSKTAYGMASLLSRVDGLEVWGLTSRRNETFTKRLGCYDRVFTYDALDAVPTTRSIAYVDVAGNTAVRDGLADRLGKTLVYSMALGDTHWDESRDKAKMSSQAEFFFAPTWLAKRTDDWGVDGYVARLAEAWKIFSENLDGWMKIVSYRGPQAIEQAWLQQLAGEADPSIGYVLSMGD